MQFKTHLIKKEYPPDNKGFTSVKRFNTLFDEHLTFNYHIEYNFFHLQYKDKDKKFLIQEQTDYTIKFLKTKIKITSKDDFLEFLKENQKQGELFHNLIVSNFIKIFNICKTPKNQNKS